MFHALPVVLRRSMAGCVLGISMSLFAVTVSGQTATTQLHGSWSYDPDDMGDSLSVHLRFDADGDSALHFNMAAPVRKEDWEYPGDWQMVSEERDEMGRHTVTIRIQWHHQTAAPHHVVVVFLERDRIEVAFNDEPLRIYQRNP